MIFKLGEKKYVKENEKWVVFPETQYINSINHWKKADRQFLP